MSLFSQLWGAFAEAKIYWREERVGGKWSLYNAEEIYSRVCIIIFKISTQSFAVIKVKAIFNRNFLTFSLQQTHQYHKIIEEEEEEKVETHTTGCSNVITSSSSSFSFAAAASNSILLEMFFYNLWFVTFNLMNTLYYTNNPNNRQTEEHNIIRKYHLCVTNHKQ